MGLETATFIGGLTPAWPLATDTKSQGDDHLRLIKSTLQATFPTAAKAFYFPTAEAISGTQTLDATDMNNTQFVDTSGGNVTVNLPSLAAGDKGWQVEIIKTTSDTNAAIVTPAAGTILTQVGAVATVRVGVLCEPAILRWTGTAWHCYKPGAAIGSTYEFDNALPAGYLELAGGTYSNTDFAELFAYLASTTLKDKGGRVSAGREAAASRLTSTYFVGNSTALGAVGGLESHQLTLAQTPSGITSVNAAQAITVNSSESSIARTGSSQPATGGAAQAIGGSGTVTSTGNNSISVTSNNTGNGSHNNVQPTIIVRKCIRAC